MNLNELGLEEINKKKKKTPKKVKKKKKAKYAKLSLYPNIHQYNTRLSRKKISVSNRAVQTRSKTKKLGLPLRKGVEFEYCNQLGLYDQKKKPKLPKVSKFPITRKKCDRWNNQEKIKLQKAVKKYRGKNWEAISKIVVTKTPNQCNQHWHRVLNPKINKEKWKLSEDNKLFESVKALGLHSWMLVAKRVRGRTDIQCRHRYFSLIKRNAEGGDINYKYTKKNNHRTGKKRKRVKEEIVEVEEVVKDDKSSKKLILPKKKRKLNFNNRYLE